MNARLRSIFYHLQWQIILPMLLLFFVFSTAGVLLINKYLQAELESRLEQRARLAAHAVQFAVESSNTVAGIQRFISAMGAEKGFEYIVVMAESTSTIISSTSLSELGVRVEDLQNKEDYSRALDTLEARKPSFGFTGNERNIYEYSSPVLISNITVDAHPLGRGSLLLRLNTRKISADINESIIWFASVLVLMLLGLMILLFELLRHFVMKPQQSLLQVVKDRQKGVKSFAGMEGHNEMATLAQAFNKMLVEGDKIDTMKNEFISTVSHELRTPLTSIKGALNLLQGLYKDNLPEESRDLLSMTIRNSERLEMLINDLLDMEKLRSGQMQFECEETNLVELAAAEIESNRVFAENAGVTIKLETALSSAITWADPSRIRQVFSNLLSNAIKFSNQSDVVTITIEEQVDIYRVSVRDNGRGMPEDFRDRIFSRFAQVDSSDTRDRGGTGLGLSICKAIIDFHDGSIDYQSEMGVGSCFYFELPVFSHEKEKVTA